MDDAAIKHHIKQLRELGETSLGTGVALMAVVSCLPETARLDRAEVLGVVQELMRGTFGIGAVERKAAKLVETILANAKIAEAKNKKK